MSWILTVATPSPSPSPSASGSGWQDILKAVAPAITAAVAVIAGAFAYAKFLRGRIFQPAVLLTLAACEVQAWEQSALRVDITVKNSGLTALCLDEIYSQRVDVFLASEATWKAAATSQDGIVFWHDGGDPHRSIDFIFEAGIKSYAVPRYRESQFAQLSDGLPPSDFQPPDYRLAAGEETTRSLLVPVDAAPAYLVLVTFRACPHTNWWSRPAHRRCRARTRRPERWQTRTVVTTSRQQADQSVSEVPDDHHAQ
jgi:hypothetical protein